MVWSAVSLFCRTLAPSHPLHSGSVSVAQEMGERIQLEGTVSVLLWTRSGSGHRGGGWHPFPFFSECWQFRFSLPCILNVWFRKATTVVSCYSSFALLVGGFFPPNFNYKVINQINTCIHNLKNQVKFNNIPVFLCLSSSLVLLWSTLETQGSGKT